MKDKLLLILLLQTTLISFSATKNKNKTKKDNNVEIIKSKFFLTPFIINEENYLTINNIYEDRKFINYKPNINSSLGITIGIYRASLTLAFKLPKYDYLGETKIKRFNFDYQMKHFGFSLFYNKYDGVLLKNPNDFIMPIGSSNFRKDVTLWYMGFNTKYIFNNRFSINASTKQTERQKKSAGSFMFLIGNTFYGFDADSSFIIGSEQKYYPVATNLNSIYTSSFKYIPGAGYTFIFGKDISFTTTLFTGFDLQLKFYMENNLNKIDVGLPFYLKTTNILGYNGEYFYTNLVYSFELNRITFNDSSFNLFINYFKISAGYRFLLK